MAARNASNRTKSGSRLRPASWWLTAEVVAGVVAALCYVNVLSNEFCDDGIPIVQKNDKVNEPGQWLTIWNTDYWSEIKDATPNRDLLYRPIALTSYRLVRVIAGQGPFPQLLVNLLLHVIVTVMVTRLCLHMGGSNAAAMVAGVLFAVLPIHTEVIANVVGRSDLLATFGVLLAVLTHRRSMNATRDRAIVSWRALAALGAFIAMGAKENGVAVIPLIVLLDGYWYRPWRAASDDRPWWSLASLIRFNYLLIPVSVYFLLRSHVLEGQLYQAPALTKTINVLVDSPPGQHLLGVIQLWGMYWAKTFWPAVLCVNYSINSLRLATGVTNPYVILGIAVTVGLIVASVWAWRKGWRQPAYLSGAILVAYLPTSNAFVLIQVYFAERIWYLPSVWLAVLAGLGLARLASRPVGVTLVALITLAMAERCWLRNAEWYNNATLYATAYRDHPDAVGALRLYGQSLVEQGRYAEAIPLLRRAIDIDLGFTDAHRTLGQAYLLAGQYDKALQTLQVANMQVPGHPPTEAALRIAREHVLAKHKDDLEALRAKADANPDDVEAEVALIRRLRELALTDEALARLVAKASRFADEVMWQYEYAVTLVYLNERDQAIDRYRKCLALAPDNPHLNVELAMLLLERRRGDDLEEAWRLAKHAEKVLPGAPFVLVCQAELTALRGELADAVALYEDAIRTLPPNSQQRRVLEERARALGQ